MSRVIPHHFHSAEQEASSAKLGMWIFLAQEILFFSGVFMAYAAIRYFYPDTMLSAHEHLKVVWGTTNTLVLLTSSLTMVLGVRAAQLGDHRSQRLFVALTIALGCTFMCIKGVEYTQKFREGLLPGKYFTGVGLLHETQRDNLERAFRLSIQPETLYLQFRPGYHVGAEELRAAFEGHHMPLEWAAHVSATFAPNESQLTMVQSFNGSTAPFGQWAKTAAQNTYAVEFVGKPHVFFGAYFTMTGLHGLHVLVGIGILVWIWLRAGRKEFGPDYFTPVDNVGLYWHLVDVVWIFLFPLLYLVR